jgi:drug/metabolite transporter (DMT)-like permease
MLLAVVCSFAWVSLDLLRKALVSQHRDPVTIAALPPLGAAIGCTVLALAQGHALPPPPAAGWDLFAALCLLNIVGNFLFIHALTVGELSAVLPLFCLTPVVGLIGALVLMGEQPSIVGLAGIAVVILGTFLILREPGETGRAGLKSMAGAVICWGLTPALDKAIIGSGWDLWTYLVCAMWAVAIPLCGERLIRAPRKLFGCIKASPYLCLALIPSAGAALGFQLAAVLQIEVGLLEAVKRAGVVLSVALAAPLFGERSAGARMPFMIIVAAGVFIVARRDAALGELVVIAVATAVLFSLTRLVVGRQRTE